ncbi:hypothetical protein LARI1_G008740 [Lachnellula arida]|uniref:Uncharacterized protein n=1 Tax=Lachnellula arida TaxID=1316785 RepID=A0A8T9B2M5_9HELO|nr:hypothetical protein LARI1_G008740 [Lachnellula arida]
MFSLSNVQSVISTEMLSFTLEYYQGIIFFITNCVKQINSAIISRIYFKIKLEKRRVGVLPKKGYDTSRPAKYSPSCHFQIKNLTSTAYALALQEGTQVTLSHLEFVIKAGEDFERNINSVGSIEAMRSNL